MFVIPDSFPWSSPWITIPDDYIPINSDDLFSTDLDDESSNTPHRILNDELHREMPPGHLLYRLATEVVAVCTVTHKDFVFVTDDLGKPIAIVHLTWSKETHPRWPHTQVITSLHELEVEIQRWGKDDFWLKPDQP